MSMDVKNTNEQHTATGHPEHPSAIVMKPGVLLADVSAVRDRVASLCRDAYNDTPPGVRGRDVILGRSASLSEAELAADEAAKAAEGAKDCLEKHVEGTKEAGEEAVDWVDNKRRDLTERIRKGAESAANNTAAAGAAAVEKAREARDRAAAAAEAAATDAAHAGREAERELRTFWNQIRDWFASWFRRPTQPHVEA